MALCDLPGVGQACNAVGDATKSVVGGAFDAVAQAFAQGLADVMKVLMTFWLNVPGPDLTSGNSAVTHLNDLTRPLIAFAAILGMIVAGGKMAVTARTGESVTSVVRGLLLMIGVTGAGALLVATLLAAFDGLGRNILDRGFDGHSVGTRLAALGALPNVGGGLLFLLALFGLIATLVQVAIMVVRGAILAVLVGVLPVAAAASITGIGYSWFKRLCGWILSFTLYKLTASVIYAAAFTMIGTGTDLAGVVGGFALLALAILALPALLRLIPPAADAIGSSGGGGMLAGLATAGATGAAAFGGKMPSGGGTTTSPGLGHATSGSGGWSGASGDGFTQPATGAGPAGPPGAPPSGDGAGSQGSPATSPADGGGPSKTGPAGGGAGAAGGAAGAGASGAGAGASGGPAGAAVQTGAQVYQAAKRGAEGAAGDGSGGNGGGS